MARSRLSTAGTGTVQRSRQSGLRLVIRADASPERGSGHVMRSSALADAWRGAFGDAVICGSVSVPFVERRLRELNVPLHADLASAGPGDVLVCDSYDEDVRAECAAAGAFAVRAVVDDIGDHVGPGFDAIWNPNAYGSRAMYPAFGGAVIAGPEVIPLRTGLPRWTGGTPMTVGVMFGGSRLSPPLREAMVALPEVAPEYQFFGSGHWVPAGWTPVPPENPWPALAACERFITSSGTTVWEAAAVGVPTIVTRIAGNQDLIFAWANRAGIPGVDALDATSAPDLVETFRAALPEARALPRILNGAARVCSQLAEMVRVSL